MCHVRQLRSHHQAKLPEIIQRRWSICVHNSDRCHCLAGQPCKTYYYYAIYVLYYILYIIYTYIRICV